MRFAAGSLGMLRLSAALALAPACAAFAQQSAHIPLRHVTTLASTDSGVIANVWVLHAMSDGHVLVNDAVKRRLLLLDPGLMKYKVVADTTGESPNPFGTGVGGLLLFPGDSTAFVDRASLALVIVDASGNFGRITVPPKTSDNTYFSGAAYGVPGFDGRGRLYYRSVLRPPGFSFSPRDTVVDSPDSAPILRADFDRRRIDTIAMMRVPVTRTGMHILPKGEWTITQFINPVPVTDEWAYLSDGTVAVVRGQDYHIDWYPGDGSHTATPRMPFDWRRLTDGEKQHIVDSVQHALDSTTAANAARAAQQAYAQGKPAPPPSKNLSEVLQPHELPDYFPAVRVASQMRADLDGNLWIIPATSAQGSGGTIFDVVNRHGEIVERVQLPAGRNLHGFGPGGIIYMSVPVLFGWPRVEKARVVRP